MKRYLLLGLIFLSTLLFSCMFPVNLNPKPSVTIEKPIDLDIGIYIAPSELNRTHSQSGICLVGVVHTWEFETGQALQIASGTAFDKAFSEVRMLNSMEEFTENTLTLLATPRVQTFTVSQEIQATLTIHCKLVDDKGNELYENTISAKGSSEFIRGCLFGVCAGTGSMRRTGEKAFEKAFERLILDITSKVDFRDYTI